jgi:hypothetical protein
MSATSPGMRMRAVAASALMGADRSGGARRRRERSWVRRRCWGRRARAGFRAREVTGGVTPCPDEASPRANAASMATLMRVLGQGDATMIGEWCELANGKGVCVWPETVPALLDWWARQARRENAVFNATGTRGAWLATLNPTWRRASAGAQVPENLDEVWHSGSAVERAGALRAVRGVDPARGLGLVQSTWQSDGSDDRKRCIDALVEGLSLADEPFLEAALDDKSKLVRGAAASALGRLTGSALRMRMNERSGRIITAEAKGGALRKKVTVRLVPPSEFDKAWERDGIEERAPGGMGKRAWWMRQILPLTDLRVWTEVTGLDPAGVLRAIASDDSYEDALHSMMQAARRQADEAWSAAIARAMLESKKVDVDDLAALCSGIGREAGELELIDHARFSPIEQWTLLGTAGHPWSRAFSEASMKRVQKHARKQGAEAWGLHETVDNVSRRVDPECADAFERAVVATCGEELTDSFRKSVDRVKLRAEMRKEFET